jgi:hypothetical protein
MRILLLLLILFIESSYGRSLDDQIIKFIDNNETFENVTPNHIKSLQRMKTKKIKEDTLVDLNDYLKDYMQYKIKLTYQFQFSAAVKFDLFNYNANSNLLGSAQKIAFAIRGFGYGGYLSLNNFKNRFRFGVFIHSSFASVSSDMGNVEYHADVDEVNITSYEFIYTKYQDQLSWEVFSSAYQINLVLPVSSSQLEYIKDLTYFIGTGLSYRSGQVEYGFRIGKNFEQETTLLVIPIGVSF